MSEIKLTVRPFEMGTEKEAAKKLPEEAAEAFAVWHGVYLCSVGTDEKNPCAICEVSNYCQYGTRLADEIADTIQVACNLAARYGIDLQEAMERCERRNRSRGRYQVEEVKNVEPIGACGSDDCNCGGDCVAMPARVGVLPKSPEEMSAEELIEALNSTDSNCRKILGDNWCGGFDTCGNCRKFLLDLLKAEHEREVEEFIELIKDGRDEYMRLRTENGIMLNELLKRQDRLDELEHKVSDLTHERDGLRRRLEVLSDAGITSLHRLLRETVGEAINITDAARIYVENARKSRKPNSERKAVIERLREIDFAQKNVSLNSIGCAVLGRTPSPWWDTESRAELRDKLIELLSNGE